MISLTILLDLLQLFDLIHMAAATPKPCTDMIVVSMDLVKFEYSKKTTKKVS